MSRERSEIRLAGSGGQGLITGMSILLAALSLEGRRAAQSQSYEPTSRGGFCYSDLVVSDETGDYPLATALDAMAALSQIGLDRSLAVLKPGALVLCDERLAPEPPTNGFDVRVLPFAARATALGSPRIANVVTLGALTRLSGLSSQTMLEEAVRREAPPKFLRLNLAAAREGWEMAG
ncbi:MAG: 2-oxoacid:acceptor oxidoreductase family protein [Roseiarcus sp.]